MYDHLANSSMKVPSATINLKKKFLVFSNNCSYDSATTQIKFQVGKAGQTGKNLCVVDHTVQQHHLCCLILWYFHPPNLRSCPHSCWKTLKLSKQIYTKPSLPKPCIQNDTPPPPISSGHLEHACQQQQMMDKIKIFLFSCLEECWHNTSELLRNNSQTNDFNMSPDMMS